MVEKINFGKGRKRISSTAPHFKQCMTKAGLGFSGEDKMKELITIDDRVYNGANWVRVDLHLYSPHLESSTLSAGADLHTSRGCEKLTEECIKYGGVR